MVSKHSYHKCPKVAGMSIADRECLGPESVVFAGSLGSPGDFASWFETEGARPRSPKGAHQKSCFQLTSTRGRDPPAYLGSRVERGRHANIRAPKKTHRTNFSRFHPPSTQASWRGQIHPFFNGSPEGPVEPVIPRAPPTRGPRSIHGSSIDGSPRGPVEFGISWRSPTGGSRCDKSYRPLRKPI